MININTELSFIDKYFYLFYKTALSIKCLVKSFLAYWWEIVALPVVIMLTMSRI